ncbi:MAG: xanthine dehydrogenase family protein molybdopterin-binding subunit [Capsulimonadaceae bacterium]
MADPATIHRHTIKVPKVVNGFEQMVDVEVDDSSGLNWPSRESMVLLDKPMRRVDGPDKVTGRATYTHDVRLPGMLYGRILPSPYPSAVAVKVDTSAARTMPGVACVVSNEGKICRYQGDPVAAVAAETPEIAEDAIRAIQVTYDIRRHVVDITTARDPDSPAIYPSGNVRGGDSHGDQDGVNAQMAGCAATAEGEFSTPVQHHCCLETHGVVVDYRGEDSATVYASTQGTFSVPGDAANALNLDESKVVCIVEHMGGGFGSKNGLDLPGSIACQLALAAKRPVHLMLTRSDEFLMAGNRSGSLQTLKLGADKDGILVALFADQHRLGGLGPGVQRPQPWLYQVPYVYRTMDSVFMNIDSFRAFRAPGCPQASFPLESLLDDLAAKLNMDPIDLRNRNLKNPTYARQLAIGAERIGWATGRNKTPGGGQIGPRKRGMGVGLSAWGGGGGPSCQAALTIGTDGAVDVSLGTQDLGTGTRTYMAAIVAEELGLDLDSIGVHIGDSRLGSAGGSGGSTTTASVAPAIKDAATNARTSLCARIAPALGAQPGELTLAAGRVIAANGKSVTWKQACSMLGSTGVTAQGQWQPGLSDSVVHGAQFAEVEVDVETGQVRVLKMVGVQDCGLPLNRTGVESQLNGGMIQGLGYALLEGKITDRPTGLMLNTNLEEYKVPGALEIPECIPIIDDADMRGVIGMAEPATIPGAAAIANAVYNACGARLRSLPITPDKVLAELGKLS